MEQTVEQTKLHAVEHTADSDNARICINVSGRRFETFESTLRRLPHSLLGDEQRRSAFYDAARGELFFDRSSCSFEGVLYVYQSGGLVERPRVVPTAVFLDDLRFYALGDEVERRARRLDGIDEPLAPRPTAAGWRGRVWTALEYPSRAPLVAAASLLVTTAAVLTWVVASLPQFKNDAHSISTCLILESVCLLLLLIELMVRLITCADRARFLWDPMNWVDLVGTAPVLVSIVLQNVRTYGVVEWVGQLCRLVLVPRVLRFVRHTSAAVTLRRTAAAAAPYLGLCFLVWSVAVVIFASLFYFVEHQGEDWGVESIPMSLWWSVVTMTTVGYGDISPSTTGGRVVGFFCTCFGYAVVGFPVAVLVYKFSHFSGTGKSQGR